MTEASVKKIESIEAAINGLIDSINDALNEDAKKTARVTDAKQKKTRALSYITLAEAAETLALAQAKLRRAALVDSDLARLPEHAVKDFMVVCKCEDTQWAVFFDSLDEAEEYRMEAMCGIDAYTELYQRDKRDTGYDLMHA